MRLFKQNLKEMVTIGLILLVFIVSGAARPELFASERLPSVINSIILWTPIILTVAMGMMMTVIIGGIDLSVGSTAALSAMIVGIWMRDSGVPLPIGVILCILFGLLFGAINGFLIAYLDIPPIIVTLGTINAYRGMTYIISDGDQITGYDLPKGISNVVTEGLNIAGVKLPILFIIAVLIAVAFYFILRYSHFGREIYAIGSNRVAAHLRGINVKKDIFMIFVLSGALSGLAGIMSAARYGYVNPTNTGRGLEFTVVTACVIGGVSPSGGSGTVPGVFLGVLLLAVINTMISMTGIPGTVQNFAYGAIVVFALVVDRLIDISRERAIEKAKGKGQG